MTAISLYRYSQQTRNPGLYYNVRFCKDALIFFAVVVITFTSVTIIFTWIVNSLEKTTNINRVRQLYPLVAFLWMCDISLLIMVSKLIYFLFQKHSFRELQLEYDPPPPLAFDEGLLKWKGAGAG